MSDLTSNISPASTIGEAVSAVAPSRNSSLETIRNQQNTNTQDTTTTEDSTNTSAPSTTSASSKPAPQRIVRMAPQIPQDLLDNADLAKAISILPSNYNFEIYKTIWRLRESRARMVALQFPEGLLMYSCIIADILAQFANVQTVIMGDVTYGACCVDDYTARALGCDFMVHYGHSCLVPIDVSTIQMLYVFVDIAIDTAHLVRSLQANFQPNAKLILAGTIQFATAIANVAQELKSHFHEMFVPQARPLSKGEVLGCTSPKFGEYDAVIFLADGRFHLESMMIHNPHIDAFYKYDPYNKKLTREVYAYEQMYALRQTAITQAKTAKKWGIILGTLGRQGNMNIVTQLEAKLKQKNLPYIIVLLSEIFPDKLSRFPQVEAWIQVACPRLSIDWGYAFQRPLLSSYEAHVALDEVEWQQVYPMDYYSDAGGSWSNYHAWTKQSIGGAAGEKKSINPIKARKEKKAREAAEKAAAAAAAAIANGEAVPEVAPSTGKIEIAYSDE